jgi:TonB family protein
MAMAASGGDLKARILRLVDHHCAPSNNISKWLAAASLLLAFFLLSLNQLLTMPFAQQLNNQFPWQESGFNQNNIINNNVSSKNVALIEPDELLTSITNDTIAQQLLKGDENIANRAQIILDLTNSAEELPEQIIPKTSMETVSSLNTSKPIDAKTDLSLSNESTLFSANLPGFSQEKTQNTKRLSPSVNLGKESKVINSPKPTTDKITLQLEQNVIEQFQKNKPADVKEDKIKNAIQSFTANKPEPLIAKLPSNSALQKTSTSDNPPISQSRPYLELSYENEILKLSQNDELYKPSFTQESIKRQTEKLKLATKVNITNERFVPAKLLNSINPEYPSLAKRRGIEMEVKVNFTIDKYGKVKDIKFPQQSKLIYFKSAIRSAIRKWRFNPAVKNNIKVESKMTKIFSFSLEA